MHTSTISFLITTDEADLLESVQYLEPWLVETLEKAKKEKGLLRIKLHDDEATDCISALTHEAERNHPLKYELFRLAKKLEGFSKLFANTTK